MYFPSIGKEGEGVFVLEDPKFSNTWFVVTLRITTYEFYFSYFT